jgi:hypothetical protein
LGGCALFVGVRGDVALRRQQAALTKPERRSSLSNARACLPRPCRRFSGSAREKYNRIEGLALDVTE